MAFLNPGTWFSRAAEKQPAQQKLSRVVQPTGVERTFDESEFMVSKTDLTGRITYANETFQRVAGYSESELIGMPHSIIRHPDMPRCVFKLLWDTVEAKHEIFAYVVNLAKNGDHYWVFAHVTPSFDENGNIVGYHSNRRVPNRDAIEKAAELYKLLRQEEEREPDRKAGLQNSYTMVVDLLDKEGVEYDEFILAL